MPQTIRNQCHLFESHPVHGILYSSLNDLFCSEVSVTHNIIFSVRGTVEWLGICICLLWNDFHSKVQFPSITMYLKHFFLVVRTFKYTVFVMLHITSLELIYFITGSLHLLYASPSSHLSPQSCGIAWKIGCSGIFSTAAPKPNKRQGGTKVACTMLGFPQRPLLSRVLVSHVLGVQAALSRLQTLVLFYYVQLFWLFSVEVLVCYNLLHHSWKAKLPEVII